MRDNKSCCSWFTSLVTWNHLLAPDLPISKEGRPLISSQASIRQVSSYAFQHHHTVAKDRNHLAPCGALIPALRIICSHYFPLNHGKVKENSLCCRHDIPIHLPVTHPPAEITEPIITIVSFLSLASQLVLPSSKSLKISNHLTHLGMHHSNPNWYGY